MKQGSRPDKTNLFYSLACITSANNGDAESSWTRKKITL